jgi:adenosylcobinamide kinase/adenosylcobinamide-phosphate guanylyltransferase
MKDKSGQRDLPGSRLTVLIGGVRSGKSAKALALADARAGGRRVLFVATAEALDDEMRARIAVHRRERPAHWETLESPLALASNIEDRLRDAAGDIGVVVIDCMTLWASNLLLAFEERDDVEAMVETRISNLLAVMRTRPPADSDRLPPREWIVVTNEVGLGVVPPTTLGRRYRDALGRANQLLASAADEVTLMVAGLELPLRPR